MVTSFIAPLGFDLRSRPGAVGEIDVDHIRLVFWDLGGQKELRELWDKVGSVSLGVLLAVFSCLILLSSHWTVLSGVPWHHLCGGLCRSRTLA